MSRRTINLDDRLYQYLVDHTLRETDVMRQLREHTAEMPGSAMQIAPEQGQFMALLVELLGARRIIEIGTFTGYSALCMAQAMQGDAELICCDVSEEYTAVARDFWARAGVERRITLRIAPARQTLEKLVAQGRAGEFDLVFIDADKTGYEQYYELALVLLRTGGLVMFDNTLWGGDVADPEISDADTVALRALNERLHCDERVSISLLPLGDGLTLARKR